MNVHGMPKPTRMLINSRRRTDLQDGENMHSSVQMGKLFLFYLKRYSHKARALVFFQPHPIALLANDLFWHAHLQ